MLLLHKTEEDQPKDSEVFGYASQYITDELELIHDQQENIIRVSEELSKAFSQAEQMKKLLKLVTKIDKTVLQKSIKEKRKEESGMINQMEEIKKLLKQQKYEDIDRLMHAIQHETKTKIDLSQKELHQLRDVMTNLIDLYQQAAGLCRLYRMVYDHIKQIYDQCQGELGIESAEEHELSTAGAYTENVHDIS
jgi:hypothetical protein